MGSIAVTGGGAAGLMAAVAAAAEGARDVFILERNEKTGKKLLATGNGKCNFTNLYQSPECYRGSDPAFAWNAVRQFDEKKVLAFFYRLGVCSKDRDGYVYPLCDQAVCVAEALLSEAKRLKVKILTGHVASDVFRREKGFTIKTDKGEFTADRVILAAGSKAAPKTGSDGSGYAMAKALGHHIVPVLPALTQLHCGGGFFRALSGVRVYAKITVFADGRFAACDTGEVQLTDYGISGIPAFQVSRFASAALREKKNVSAELDFMPDFTEEGLSEFLKERKNMNPDKPMGRFLNGIFQSKLSAALIKAARIDPAKKAGECREEEMGRLKKAIGKFSAEVLKVSSFEHAQVCLGGVDTSEVDVRTMQSRIVSGLYFAGEILDVDGVCGGYNLQWAWSSGHIAGKSAAISLKGFTKN